MSSHKHSASLVQNHKAHLANAYNELGKELSSSKIKVIGNYTLGRVIGEGAYGKVRMGTHRLTATRVAVKQIPKEMSSQLTREIHHHRTLHHPHVAQMYEVIATENSIWIITELCSGGELFDYLVEKGRLSEDETRIIVGQICLAVAYLHDKGIVHRDLKLENVLLDERCRVKLSDYGFTREFERGSLMETFCGTTGYASPEMLERKKYQGPEVDVWSLGVILYCLLTGTLPFDDDDESVMQQKIIKGDFEDPEWLSEDARDLIKKILVKDTSARLTISRMLAHNWFKPPAPIRFATPPPSSYRTQADPPPRISEESSSESHSTSSGKVLTSVPTTPEDDPFDPAYVPAKLRLHSNESQSTVGKRQSLTHSDIDQPETVMEEQEDDPEATPLPRQRTDSNQSKAPPISTLRTPARTKRRSVSSTLSDDNSTEKTPTIPNPPTQDNNLDFSSLLTTASPIIFSTPLERQLLNSLSLLGFDLGQIVYSVMNDACDSASAMWWIMLRKAEKKLLDGDVDAVTSPSAGELSFDIPDEYKKQPKKTKHGVGVQTEGPSKSVSSPPHLDFLKSPPQLGVVPPTPTAPTNRPNTPPTRAMSPGGKTPLLTPSSSARATSNPTTPSGSTGKGRAKRSGSVSIMQRATTALEAAGLVRKKSSEAVREHLEKDRVKTKEKEKEKEKDADKGPRSTKSSVGDESRSSHGSGGGPSRLTKSPPPRPPTTPPPSEASVAELHAIGSPWVLTESSSAVPSNKASSTPVGSPPGIPASKSQPLPSTPGPKAGPSAANNRNRGNFLNQFRLWLNEDRKGKRKDNTGSPNTRYKQQASPSQAYPTATMKRRTSTSGAVQRGRGTRRAQRPSVSSRRSSSVNSRRSSITSVQMVVLDSPSAIAGRRSMGAHTPNDDRAGEISSRPSSIRSFSMQRHGKSPSASSLDFRAASPNNQRYHRRGGSGSSTRVVRQMQPRPAHHRSNSATSSIHSPVSSRPPSFIEPSESESGRIPSPFRQRRHTDASDGSGSSRRQAYFVAQKKQVPFASPMQSYGSIGRTSWKKSWGLEPPGWRTRSTPLPVEVLAISPAAEGGPPRDVFAGRHSLSLGDESDWVDEEDDGPYAVGLGQGLSKAPAPTQLEQPISFSPAPKDHGRGKRNKSGSSTRGKGAHQSPATTHTPLPAETIYEGATRRQLPNSRPGPAAIQEEDEDEEE